MRLGCILLDGTRDVQLPRKDCELYANTSVSVNAAVLGFGLLELQRLTLFPQGVLFNKECSFTSRDQCLIPRYTL